MLFQVFLLLVKRLASLHYNHPELPQDNNLKSLVSPPQATTRDSSFQTTTNCRTERDNNINSRSTSLAADYDEVDFQSTSDCNHTERINETINNSSRTQKNMGSNVSTAGGKGLSGRRTQSSSKFCPFLILFHFIKHAQKFLWSFTISWIARFKMNVSCDKRRVKDIVFQSVGFVFIFI